MRKLAHTVLFLFVSITLISAVLAGFLHVAWMRLPWFAAYPFPYVAHLSFVSAVLWGLFAIRLVWRAPLLVMFGVRAPTWSAVVVAPLYPEDVVSGMGLVMTPTQIPAKPPEPHKEEPPKDS